MTDPLEILDTAVKIGLGALISGLVAYLLARLGHSQDITKQRVTRRASLLEEVAEDVQEFTHQTLIYWALIGEWASYKRHEDQIPEDRLAQIATARNDLFGAFGK